MQLSADFNWEVCMPTTPSQIFHLLRRQMLRKQRKPLVVFTPKSLLRHKDATSSLDDLCAGTFQTVFGEVFPHNPKQITRVVCCTGKVYYDLLKARNERQLEQVAIIRTPQIYPMDDRRLLEELDRYPKMKELVWCQEEPENQGAWYAKHHRLIQILKKGQTLQLASRPASASPAVGSLAKHLEQQQAVVDAALGGTK
jgi:2-oxoglutarate dehydrogenase E1 component